MLYYVKRRFKKFDTDNHKDIEEYEELLNDPFCTIITERIEKVREETYSEDTGRICKSQETIWKMVTWDEKILQT